MKKFLLLLVSKLMVFAAVAQEKPGNSNNQQGKNGRLYGRVVDGKTNKGIEAVSVQLLRLEGDNVVSTGDSLAGGMLTRPNGDFSIDNLDVTGKYRLAISAIGYARQEFGIAFSRGPGNKMETAEKDMGNIKLQPDAQFLNTVTVTGTKPALQMSIDRKVFDVQKSLTSTGGTAIDVMKNIPSVTVDADGNVLLRNTSPQIFVDGRPTILTLDQIPADNIERVELITNPSAKFDASSVGGIINVVLKKDKKYGLNGIASIGAGSPNILNGNLALNLRQGKFNFFVNGSHNESGGNAKSQTLRENRNNGITEDYFNQYSQTSRQRRFNSIRFGMDYYLDNRNTLTISQHFVKGRFTSNEHQDQEFLDINKALYRYGKRESDGSNQFNRSSTQLVFKHTFVETGRELSADINYNRGNGGGGSSITNDYFNPDGSSYPSPNLVRNDGSNNNQQVTAQVDYIDPVGENGKIETGIRSYFNEFTSVYNAFSVSNGGETKLPLSNNYKYRENINALYFTYSNKWLGVTYQAGIRAEHSKFDGELVDSARKFGYQYPNKVRNLFDALFPSLFLTKEIGDGQEIQLNYSRRIRRPDFWQLNPFIDINDPFNIRQGNPSLKPEFTHSLEFNYNKTYNSGSFLGVLYFRNTQGDITRYGDTISTAQYQQLNNANVDQNAILNTFINANYQDRMGAEFTLQQKIGNQFDFTPTVNLQYRKVKAIIGNNDLSNEGFNWDAKLILNYKISTAAKFFDKLSFQVTSEYESAEVTPQGKNKAQYATDFALRKEFLKNNRGVITFSLNDVFNTRRWGNIYDTKDFYQDSYRRWDVRSFRIMFSYKFGKSDFNLFKKNNGKGEREERDNDQNQGQPQGGN